jgi:hypothetical protein
MRSILTLDAGHCFGAHIFACKKSDVSHTLGTIFILVLAQQLIANGGGGNDHKKTIVTVCSYQINRKHFMNLGCTTMDGWWW